MQALLQPTATIMWKTFNLIFSKFQCLPTSIHHHPPPNSPSQNFQNFNTLYDHSCSSSDHFSDDCVPDFSSAFASNRFFLSSPGTSSSISDLLQPPPPPPNPTPAVRHGVAVQTDSPDPYSDFRNSMVEMIESSDFAEADWELLRELLELYLMLNPKHAHKFIVSAFADVVVSMADGRRRTRLRRRRGLLSI